MTRDDIIRMARDALAESDGEDYYAYDCERHWWGCEDALQSFAALVAASEREACAKACDLLHWDWHMDDESGPKECASVIRARGQK